jgi:hypothetical protein
MDDCHEFQEERPLEDVVVPDVKAGDLNVNNSSHILSPEPQDTSRLICPIGVNDWPNIMSWNVSCTGVRSAKLRPIYLHHDEVE